PDALTLTFTRAEGKNVGSYALETVSVNNDNYEITLPENEWFTITVYKLTVDSLPEGYKTTKEYNADGFAPADIKYTLNNDDVVISFNKSDKNKGTYKLKDLFKQVNNSNYEVTISDALTVSITECKKVISLEEIPEASRSAVYNGKAITPASFDKDYTFSVDGQAVTETLTISFKAVGTNVGTYKLEIASVTIGGKTATNYSVSLAVKENNWFEITKCTLELTKLDFGDAYTWSKRYDGKIFTPASITKSINGETITIEFESIGPNVVTETLKPKANSNYSVTVENDVKASITAYAYELKEVDIKNGSKTKVYTGQELTPDAMTLTLVEGETLTISFNKVGKNVDTYALVIASTKIEGENATNYSITLPENKWFSITPFKYTLKAGDVSFTKVYGKADTTLSKEFAAGAFAHEGNAELKNPDALTLTFTRAEGNTVGTYALLTVTVDETNKNNYAITLSDNKWFSITKAELTFTVSKVYDGTTAFTNGNVTSVTGKVGADEILLSGNYPSKDATTSAAITVYTLSGAASANYSVKTVTGTINKFTYTLKQEDVKLSKVYGHADPELKVTLTKNSEGINNPDELVITFTREEGSSVGKYKLTIASVKYSSGDDATNNYTITIPDDNTFFEIEAVKQGLMVAVDGEFAMTYDTTTVTRVATELDSNKWYLAAYTTDGTLKARVGLSLYFNDQVAEGTWEVKAVTSDLATMFDGITISIADSLRNVGKYALSISGHNDIYTADATFVDSSYVSASPVFEIKKFTKVLTASELTKDSSWTKAYDGTALTPNSVTKEFIAGETVTIDFASVGTDAKKYALSVSGTNNENYEISVEDNDLLEITKRAYTLTASDVASVNSKVYSNSTITPDSIELTLVNNEKLTISFNAVSGTTVGEYEMVVSSVMLGENVAANYEIKEEPGNKWFSITKFKYTVVEGDLGQEYVRTKTYDGTSLQPATITKELNGETIEISFKATGVNVNDYALEYAGVSNDNYDITISANTWLKITEYTYELKESDLTTSESKTAVYTSKAITPGSITLEKVTGEILTITFEDVEKTVGKKALVIKTVRIGGGVASNYNITIPAGNTWFEVTQYNYTVTEDDVKDIVKTKVYDGENLAPASITKELIADSGETVTINFAPVGTDAKKYALAYASSSDAVNYNITVAANEWLEITKKAYTLTVEDVAATRVKTYTGHDVTPDPIEITLVGNETLKVTFKVAGKDASTYDMVIDTVTLNGVEATNYDISIPANNQWFSIEHGTYMISKSDFPEDYVWSREYNGQKFTPAPITLKLGDDTITVNFEEVDANVGPYTLKIKNMVNAENFDIDINPLTVSITKLSYTLAESDLTDAAKTAQYNGKVITPGSITLEKVPGEILTIAFKDVEKNAGEYPLVIKSVTLGGVDATNYDIKLPTAGLTFTVTQIKHVISLQDLGENYVLTKTYDGTNLAPASISLKLIEGSDEAVTISFTSVGPNAGEYALAISSVGDTTNYDITITENTWLSITQKALDITVTKTYDETTSFDGANISIKGIVGSDEVTASGSYASANATESATFTGVTLTGAASANYSVGNVTGSIAKYNIVVAAEDIENRTKVYDGKELTNTVVKTPFTTAITVTFKSVGPKFGTYDLEFDSVSDSTNYTATVPYGVTLEIKKFAYTLKEGDVSFTKVYGKNDPDLKLTFEAEILAGVNNGGLTNPDQLVLTFTRAAGETVGSYALTSVVADNENYDISLPADCKWFTITQLTHVIKREELPEGYVLTKKYDRNKFKPASITLKLIEGSEESITVNFSEVGPNAGKYDLTILSVSDNVNYSITINGAEWLEITKAELNVTVSKVYDGTTAFTNDNATITGILGSDEVTVSGNYDSKDATESATITNITLDGAQKDNYYIESATGTISKYNIEVAADEIVNTTKIYDGNKLENVLVKSLHSADITITFEAVGPDAGKYALKLASISDETNYTVTVPDVTLTISKFTYTLKEGDVSFTKVYGTDDPELKETFEIGRITETTNSALTNPDALTLT
ncbi:MBG domain-containing protein, partial [Bacteroides sp. Phil13]|uniref:MBG domain-containing protein n=1 Tax=Bacteroides sp. Phil13 TaxID=1929999 RepID=UPI002579F2BF